MQEQNILNDAIVHESKWDGELSLYQYDCVWIKAIQTAKLHHTAINKGAFQIRS